MNTRRQIAMPVKEAAASAKRASIQLAALETEKKNSILTSIRDGLDTSREELFAANAEDLAKAKKDNVASPLVKRLKLDAVKLEEVLRGITSLVSAEDPVGKILTARELDSGLELFQVSCSIGLIGVIFESRPDALVQISTLCLKSGNAVMLKGGSEAAATNRVLKRVIESAAAKAGAPDGWIQLVETRDDVREMLSLEDKIDLLVPRGSNEFVRFIMQNTNIPVLGHADGICHAYVHADADQKMAVDVVVDSKTQYVAVCNAVETLLVHTDKADTFLPEVAQALRDRGVELRGCRRTRKIIEAAEATERDWETEYLDLILSIKIVDSLDEAIDHINTYGSNHTDTIVATDRRAAERFMTLVDSANVMWNCSTRFADGYRFGLGAEVGISTSKIHARGPVGLEGLCIYKWKLYGSGQVVADYTGPGKRSFTHRPISES